MIYEHLMRMQILPVRTCLTLTVVWHDLPNNSDLVLWPKASTDSYRSRGILTI